MNTYAQNFAVRASAPDFTLPGSGGVEFQLSSRQGVGSTLLVFIRGHWCPYCRRYLQKIQANLPRLAERHVAVIAISPEPVPTSDSLARELGLEFPILSDVDGTVIDRYGTRNGFLSSRTLLPHPSVFLIDGDLQIWFKSIDRNYKKRTTMHAIFRALDERGAD